MKIYTIYRALNTITLMSYIGFDSNWPKRKYYHLRANKRQYFHNAIQKYGKDAFSWEIIYQSLDKDHCLSMEEYFIQQFDSRENGYNIAIGGIATYGFLGKSHTENSKQKLRLSHLGKKLKPHSQETKQKIGIGNKGKIVSDLAKQKMSNNHADVTGNKNPNSQTYLIVENGNEYQISCLKNWCKDKNINYSTARAIVRMRMPKNGLLIKRIEVA